MSAARDHRPQVSVDNAVVVDVPSAGAETSTSVAIPYEFPKTAESDWPSAIGKVERAVSLIRTYEQKLRTLQDETRTLMVRVADEQEKARERNRELEQQLEHLEAALKHTTEDLRESKVVAWEAKLHIKSLEADLADAKAEMRRGSTYVQRVEELLRDL